MTAITADGRKRTQITIPPIYDNTDITFTQRGKFVAILINDEIVAITENSIMRVVRVFRKILPSVKFNYHV